MRKGMILSLEAFIALIAVLSVFLLSQPSYEMHSDYRVLREYQLLQDFLETSAKNEETLSEITRFGETGESRALEEKYSLLLERTGGEKLVLEYDSRELVVGNEYFASNTKLSGTRLVYADEIFKEIRLTLYFPS